MFSIVSPLSLVPVFAIVLVTSALLLFVHHRRRKHKYLAAEGKCVLITGCDSGIGLRLATHLHAKGFVVFCGVLSVQSDGARILSDGNNYDQDRVHVLPIDITKRESLGEAAEYVSNYLERRNIEGLWALVNNAGVCAYGEFDWLTFEQIEMQINVNLTGTMMSTKTFLSLVRKAKGRIVNVGSVNGSCAYPGIAAYCASKFGIEGFTDVLRYEMSKFDVKVVLIRPGDFARLTSIMGQHERNAKEMWDAMSVTDRDLYKDYFKAYHDHILQNYGMTSPNSFEHSTLLADFEEALLSKYPRFYVTVAPLGFRVFFTLLQLLPPSAKDTLVEWLTAKVFKFQAKSYFPKNS